MYTLNLKYNKNYKISLSATGSSKKYIQHAEDTDLANRLPIPANISAKNMNNTPFYFYNLFKSI